MNRTKTLFRPDHADPVTKPWTFHKLFLFINIVYFQDGRTAVAKAHTSTWPLKPSPSDEAISNSSDMIAFAIAGPWTTL